MIKASCHCGAVQLELDTPPSEVTECNCSICRRYGVLWAYYSPHQVRVLPRVSPTEIYQWDDKSIAFHRCQSCGCVSHWTAVNSENKRMGVNARLLAPEVLARARVRYLDGANTEQYTD